MSVGEKPGKSLWGPSFLTSPVESAPVALLREQAGALTRQTDGRVVGVVNERVVDRTAWTSLSAEVPALHGYQHKILSIAHPIVVPDPVLPFDMTVSDHSTDRTETVSNMGHFEHWLSGVLSSDPVHTIINGLLRYGNDPETEKDPGPEAP